MHPFDYVQVDNAQGAIDAHLSESTVNEDSLNEDQYIAGGTTLIDLMRLSVMQPDVVIDINKLETSPSGRIKFGPRGLWLGALTRMSAAADHPEVRKNFPVIAQSLELAASPQLRNMATLGGNVLQRTRCTYFRDISYSACNKRKPGSGCAAMEGFNRSHAVLGTSEDCIATYPGDFAQALIALDAVVDIAGEDGSRTIPFAQLHKAPDRHPHIETTLEPGDLIMAFMVPPAPWAKRSLFLKIRDRESYEFALASAAVALDLENGRVREARVALGGVGTIPWRAREAEAILKDQPLSDVMLTAAADKAFERARPMTHNAFKVELGKRTMIRALRQAAALEI
jgi:xanthine dehydrogenase YagS FAD-binding subunit